MITNRTILITAGIIGVLLSPFFLPGITGWISDRNEESKAAIAKAKRERLKKQQDAAEAVRRASEKKRREAMEAKDPCSKTSIIYKLKRNYKNYIDLVAYRNSLNTERDGSLQPTAYYALEASKLYTPSMSKQCRGDYAGNKIKVFNKELGVRTIDIEKGSGSQSWEFYIGKIHHYGEWSQACKDLKKIMPEGTLIPDKDNACKMKPHIGDYPGYGRPANIDEIRKNEQKLAKAAYERRIQEAKDRETKRIRDEIAKKERQLKFSESLTYQSKWARDRQAKLRKEIAELKRESTKPFELLEMPPLPDIPSHELRNLIPAGTNWN